MIKPKLQSTAICCGSVAQQVVQQPATCTVVYILLVVDTTNRSYGDYMQCSDGLNFNGVERG